MSTNIPENLLYTEEHEWVKVEGNIATIGITDFAQGSLGDIVFLELPEVDTELEKGGTFGVVESIKSVSDLYAPLTGKVIEANSELADGPEAINSDAYANWLIKVEISNASETEELMNSSKYAEHCDG